MKICGVYLIQCIYNNKKYIGSSINCRDRWHKHRGNLRYRRKNANKHLQEDWSVYGESGFIFAIIEECSRKDLNLREDYYIEKFTSYLLECGYNIRSAKDHTVYEGGNEIVSNGEGRKVLTINQITKEVLEFSSILLACEYTEIRYRHTYELLQYWNKDYKNPRRSSKGYLLVYKDEYDENFDYINYRRDVKPRERKSKKSRDYKKKPEDIIPYSERTLKRTSIESINISTGERNTYRSVTDCAKIKDLNQKRIHDCLSGRRKSHRGYIFSRITDGGENI